MSTFAPKVLADGQLGAVKGTLYTSPAAPVTKTYTKQLRLFSNGAAQTCIIFINATGTSRRYYQVVLDTNESADVFEEPLQLEAGDTIEGQATNAGTVDFVITGVQEV
jgi:hypothetical protein